MQDTQPAWTTEQLRSPHERRDKSRRVRSMFNAIAPRYELVNTLFSAGSDARWRRRAIDLADVRPDDDVLDVACGTGDFARAFSEAGARRVVGCDFAREMLARAADRSNRSLAWCEADALALPFHNDSFSITSCAFGVRNFQELDRGLAEMHRVLRPGGRAVILEFTRPTRVLARWVYEVYANGMMPVMASWISGDRSGAYRYLPRSVVTFLDAARMCERLRRAGFTTATATPLTFGVVTVYVATRD